MKQKNESPFLENGTNKKNEPKTEEQHLYNLLFSGKISLKEYFAVLGSKTA